MKKINNSFICSECGEKVSFSLKTCRNHCPYCFVSMHLDKNIPGDRESTCKGKMYPVNYIISNQEIKILFECKNCGKQHFNKISTDDQIGNIDYYIDLYRCNF